MKIKITRGEASFEGGCQNCGARSARTAAAGNPIIEYVNLVVIGGSFPGLRHMANLVQFRFCDACLPGFGADVALAVRNHQYQLEQSSGEEA